MPKHDQALKALQDDFLQVSDNYASNFKIKRDELWFLAKVSEEVGEMPQAHLRLTGRARTDDSAVALREKLADEVANVLGMLLIYANSQDIDVSAAVQRKWLRYLPT